MWCDIVHCMWRDLPDPHSPPPWGQVITNAYMGRSWGQRLLMKILLEGSLVPNPHSCAGESLGTRLPGGCRQIQFLVRKRKKGTNHSEFLFCFLQKNEKGMHQSEFLLCFLQINEKETRVSEFCFYFCHGKEKRKYVTRVWFFISW